MGSQITIATETLDHNGEGQRSDRPAVLSRFARFKSRYGCCLLLPASKSQTQSSSTERQEDRGRETSAVSPSLSPPLGPLWQHLLPPLHFPIMQWACPLCCPPSFIVLANHCPYQAVPTMHQWWPEGAGETGASEGMTPSNTMSLTPRETATINKIQTKTMLRHLFKGGGRYVLRCNGFDLHLHPPEENLMFCVIVRVDVAVVQIFPDAADWGKWAERRKKGRKTKWRREMELWEKIRARSLGTCDRWSSWISCLSLCDLGCCGHFVCSNSTMEEGRERNLCFPTRFTPKNH